MYQFVYNQVLPFFFFFIPVGNVTFVFVVVVFVFIFTHIYFYLLFHNESKYCLFFRLTDYRIFD